MFTLKDIMFKLGIMLLFLFNILDLGYSRLIGIRNLNNKAITIDEIKCINYNNSCICPDDCLDVGIDSYCILKKCWRWSASNHSCVKQGPSYTSALVWQSIPFTGIFGAGFGNMGRWDLFGYGSIIWGVGMVLPCILLCIYMGTYIEVNPINVFKIYTCLFSCTVIAYYIWGIYVISTKQVRDSNGCEFINT